MSFDLINDATGFANGDKFTSDAEVLAYFTTANMRQMFGADDAPTSQADLDEMAAAVIANRWHMV